MGPFLARGAMALWRYRKRFIYFRPERSDENQGYDRPASDNTACIKITSVSRR